MWRSLTQCGSEDDGARAPCDWRNSGFVPAQGYTGATPNQSGPTRDEPPAGEQRPVETTVQRLLRLEHELVYACADSSSRDWLSDRQAVLEQFIRAASDRVTSLGIEDWNAAEREDVRRAMQAIEDVLHEEGFAFCVKTRLISDALGSTVVLDDPDASKLKMVQGL